MAANAFRNRLLNSLLPSDLEILKPHLRHAVLPLKRDMERPHQRIENVYFMEAGIASVVAQQEKETEAEVGLIGCEGMSGIAVLLGAEQTPHSTYMQVAGEAQKISAAQFRAAVKASETMSAVFLKYVHVFMMQTSQTAIANARTPLFRRLARWILMAQDRTLDNMVPLTHEFLSLMLGVRRAGVTETLQTLKQQKLIETGRNLIIVKDRKGLQKLAGAAYGGPEGEYRRLIR
jgi:CRP-like cAMP-binding protein